MVGMITVPEKTRSRPSSWSPLSIDIPLEPLQLPDHLLSAHSAESDEIEQDFEVSPLEGGFDDVQRRSLIQDLALRYSDAARSTSSVTLSGSVYTNPFLSKDGRLDPRGDGFSSRAWIKALSGMMAANGHGFATSGVAFQHLNVFGFGGGTDYQTDLANIWLKMGVAVGRLVGVGNRRRQISILRDFQGVVHKGEMLVVLGPPGSGCSTLLKTIAGEMNGIHADRESYMNYQGKSFRLMPPSVSIDVDQLTIESSTGLTAEEMHTTYRGESIYTAENDVHFPMLSVGDTLSFAAHARCPRDLPPGVSKLAFVDHMRDVVMAIFGISHTKDTRVGNDFVRGISGGERKRVTIAEAALSKAPLQCWDNSTRGLDAINAIEFCKALRLQSDFLQASACVSIYQAPQSAYDLFDKATVLYQGHQIFFGRADEARQYFEGLGFRCLPRQTTPDFLTSMTSPQERERAIRPGFENRVPRSPQEFVYAWRASARYKDLQKEIDRYKSSHPINGADAQAFRASRRAQQAQPRLQRVKSSYTLSYPQQVRLCLWRGWKRLLGDPSVPVGSVVGNFIMALIVSSVYYNLQPNTSSFVQRGSLLFFACLLNAFAAVLEIFTQYAQRPIVEKQSRYALYHPSAEAISSIICDLPYKTVNCIVFNTTLYFMTNLRREPGPFFFFLLIGFSATLVMSMMIRLIASSSRSVSQAEVPASILLMGLFIFTGFVVPIDYMLGWCRWMNYIDPLGYAFEAMMVNEFQGRQFQCTEFIPSYSYATAAEHICDTVGAEAGADTVNGSDYIGTAYRYCAAHKWRNFGILIGITVVFFLLHVIAVELISEKKSTGEVLVFRRGRKPALFQERRGGHQDDPESASRSQGPVVIAAEASHKGNPTRDEANIERQTSVFHWRNLCYEIQMKGETKHILDRVDGWVKPGMSNVLGLVFKGRSTLTALMGVSGAGKTTLLNCLADRIAIGMVSGQVFVDGRPRDISFQRKTGYAQQQDLHLETSTVREALNFSALLRQPSHISRKDKLDHSNKVIELLDMHEYADAIIGVPGQGLNVEQRKRLTIGVELAAKPPFLLFVDEPTSGLDSQTSWAILSLLQKLSKSGQAILCTIHQPSAELFQRFDRLLLMAAGGKTVYFGDVGDNAATLTSYFESNGAAHPCPPSANPAEWMLETIGAAPGAAATEIDWPRTWRESPEYASVQRELDSLASQTDPGRDDHSVAKEDGAAPAQFAASFLTQLSEVTVRSFQHYWRTPHYILSKGILCTVISLYIGFVFYNMPNTIQGLQNQMFAIFLLLNIFNQLVQQTIPLFISNRDLFEARESPSKAYSWPVFILSQIIIEVPWNSLLAAAMYFCWYYPVGLYHNAEAADQVSERGLLAFLFLWAFMMFTCTFTAMVASGMETAEGAGQLSSLLYSLCIIFCGVLATPSQMPGFWVFMYRVSPFHYLISGLMTVSVSNAAVTCAANELLQFQPARGQTCGEYMAEYIQAAGAGYLLNQDETADCSFCKMDSTNSYLAGLKAYYQDRWWEFGLLWVYIVFNILAALGHYWLRRVPKKRRGNLG